MVTEKVTEWRTIWKRKEENQKQCPLQSHLKQQMATKNSVMQQGLKFALEIQITQQIGGMNTWILMAICIMADNLIYSAIALFKKSQRKERILMYEKID